MKCNQRSAIKRSTKYLVILASLICAPLQANEPKVARLWVTDAAALSIPEPDDSKLGTELEQLKTRQAELNAGELNNIRYWAAGGPNYRWLQQLLKRYAKGPPSPLKGRGIKLLNLAIYDAVVASENAKLRYNRPRPSGLDTLIAVPDTNSYPSTHAAAASAAAGVLAYLLPEEAATFANLAESAAQSRIDAGVAYPSDTAAGSLIGQQVAEQIVAYGKADKTDITWSGKRPTGPGKLKGEKFVYPAAGQWTPTVAMPADKFLPAAPPSYDSPEMQKELQALRDIKRIVPMAIVAWVNHSTYRAFQWWYEQLAVSMFEHDMFQNPLESSHIYASVSTANSDTMIACFNAKYTWWQIRPGQLDASLPTLFPSPPHPSYPSAHSCSGGSYAQAMGHYFPDRADEFRAVANEGGYSRLIAGIHYPSDHEAGSEIGNAVASAVIEYADALITP